MKMKKIFGVFIVIMLIATAVLPVVGIMDDSKIDDIIFDTGGDYYPAATDAEIKKSIADGIAWLASQQDISNPNTNPNFGSWGSDSDQYVHANAITALVLLKLQDYAYELGYYAPWDPYYPYYSNVMDGWWYLLTPSINTSILPTNGIYIQKQSIGIQNHVDAGSQTVFNDDPDSNGNGIGIYLSDINGVPSLYHTGILLSALISIGEPVSVMGRTIDFDEDGDVDLIGEIAQDVVDWIAYAQTDEGYGRGGFNYGPQDNSGSRSDNSISGYVYQGLAAAEALTARPGATAFACIIPHFVKRELDYWIENIQDPGVLFPEYDGGSWYTSLYGGDPPNELRTGNLIFEMKFYGDNPDISTRFLRALNFIERYWRQPDVSMGWGFDIIQPDYQAMFCLMKGLSYSGITLIDTDGLGTGPRDDNWYNKDYSTSPYPDLASVIVSNQDLVTTNFGSWPICKHSDNQNILSTVWALLTLEKVVPLCGELSLSKDAPLTSYQGDTIKYTINYGNSGDTTVHNAYITDYVPSGTTFYDCSPPGVSPPPYIYWFLGDLLPGASGSVSFRVTVNQGDPIGSIVNDVYIYSDDTNPSKASAETILIYSDIPPDNPTISGPTVGKAGVQYNYTVKSIDPDGESIFYFYDWGDGSEIEWVGPCGSGEEVIVNHSWEAQEKYTIKVMAVNENNAKSDWTELEVSMPKTKSFSEFNPWIFRLIQRFPILEFLL